MEVDRPKTLTAGAHCVAIVRIIIEFEGPIINNKINLLGVIHNSSSP
jgi:hypothetical protein